MERRPFVRRHDPRIRRESRLVVKLETLSQINIERAARIFYRDGFVVVRHASRSGLFIYLLPT